MSACIKLLVCVIGTALVSGCASHAQQSAFANEHPNIPATAREATATPTSDSLVGQEKSDLSGYWVLNRELSDDIKEKMRQIAETSGGKGRGGARGGMGGGGRGGDGPKGMPGGAQTKDAQGGSRNGLADLMRPSRVLRISHQEPMLTITNDRGRKKTLFTDNRGTSVSASGGMNQEVSTCGWEQGALVVETTLDSGQRLIQRYELEENGEQLSIIANMQTPKPTEVVAIKQVYERQKAPGGDSQ